VQFYRTLNGVEIDFVVEKFTSKFVVECKYKNTDKPIKIMAINNFVKDEGFDRGYIANISYYNNTVSPIMMPGIFAEKIN
jgi:predicted AAA+ superfamily ATPase